MWENLTLTKRNILLHRSVNNCEGSEILSCFIHAHSFHTCWQETWRSWVRDEGLYYAQQVAWASCLAWFPLPSKSHRRWGKGELPVQRGSSGFALQLRSPELGESTAVIVNCKQACSLSGGDVTSSFKVACCKQSPEKWPGWTAVRALPSWHTQQEYAGRLQGPWQLPVRPSTTPTRPTVHLPQCKQQPSL